MTPGRAPLRVCIFGLGAIGRAAGRALLETDDTRITGAIDTDRRKVGRDLRSVLRLKGSMGVRVSSDVENTFLRARPDVVLHATGSRLAQIAPQLEMILEAGISCVTSSEEMAYPETTDPALARRLDRLARKRKVALLGAGVNPGFVMDALVMALSGASRNVSHITVERVLDPMSRRPAFRKKVGLGLTFVAANRLVSAGRIGHIGLRQSALLMAHGLGWDIDSIDEDLQIMCENETPRQRSRKASSDDSSVRGLRQSLVAHCGSRERIRMDMVMVSGVEAPHDAMSVTGDPDLSLWIHGGVPGDQATVARLINGMKHLINPPRAGLLTLLDLPLCPKQEHTTRSPHSPTRRA